MAFAPSDLPGLATWLRASDLTATLANGDPVTTWPDASGNSLPAIQIPTSLSTVATRPTLATGQTATGGAAVRFQKSLTQALYWGDTNPFASFTAGEVVAYFRSLSNTPVYPPSTPFTITNPAAVPYETDSITALQFTDNNVPSALSTGFDFTQWMTLATGGRTGRATVYVNGSLVTNYASGGIYFGYTPILGGYVYSTTGGYWFDGYMAEFMIFDHVLSDTDRLQVRDYLLDRHEGVTPPDRAATVEITALPGAGLTRMPTSAFVQTFGGPSLDPAWAVEYDSDDPDHLPSLAIVDHRLQWDFDATWGQQNVDVFTTVENLSLVLDEFSFQGYLDNFNTAVNTELYVAVFHRAPSGSTYPYGGVYFDIYQGDLNFYWYHNDGVDYLYGGDVVSPYDPVAHSWLKITQESDLRLRFYASPDRDTWTELYASPDPVPAFSNCAVDLWAYHDLAGGRTQDMVWVDSLNGLFSILPLPDILDAATATVTISEGLYPLINLAGKTATAVLSATVGALSLTTSGVVLEGATGTAQIQASLLAKLPATYSVGDPFEAPEVISGSTGSFTADITTTTTQTGEPDLGTSTHTYWASYTPPYGGTLTLTSPTTGINFAIDVYAGAALETVQQVGTVSYPGGEPLDVTVAANQPISIRVRGITGTDTGDVDVAWTLTSTIYDGILQLREAQLQQTPGALVATAFNFAPDTQLTFRVNGIAVYTATTDETGTLAFVSVPVDTLLDPGTYSISLTAADSGEGSFTETAETTFTVLQAPLQAPEPVVEDNEPVDVAPTVNRWIFQDKLPTLLGGIGSYVVPFNPAEMSTPVAPRAISSDHTTAADGQAIFWEGGRNAHEWTFRGYLETQEHYDKLAAFAALNRRFWIIDHRKRGWEVTIVTFDPTPRRNTAKPWAHDYEVSALIYDGPRLPQ